MKFSEDVYCDFWLKFAVILGLCFAFGAAMTSNKCTCEVHKK